MASAAWVLSIVATLTFIVGALILTVIDPVMQALMDSAIWSSTTPWGQDALRWQADIWAFFPVAILISILLMVWIRSRQPTA